MRSHLPRAVRPAAGYRPALGGTLALIARPDQRGRLRVREAVLIQAEQRLAQTAERAQAVAQRWSAAAADQVPQPRQPDARRRGQTQTGRAGKGQTGVAQENHHHRGAHAD